MPVLPGWNSICMQSIKEHNLKANHNCIWDCKFNRCLYAIYQRTQFESKSQQCRWRYCNYRFCMQSIKEHNLKANHNWATQFQILIDSVCNLSKNTIWKQITTFRSCSKEVVYLYAIYQRTQFESKSQQARTYPCAAIVCMQSIKEHNLKANHNRIAESMCHHHSVCNLSKNTIWKQITTNSATQLTAQFLYAIYQRTQFESKSQLILENIHEVTSVCNLSKNTIWKQITTT